MGINEPREQNKECTKHSIKLVVAFSVLKTSNDPHNIKTSQALSDAHEAWKYAAELDTDNRDNKPRHPLYDIILTLIQGQIPKVTPQRRTDTGLSPHNLRHSLPIPDSKRLEMTAEVLDCEPQQMRLMNALPKPPMQMELLPNIIPPESELVPILPLGAYESVKGAGRGAPIEQRLFINVLIEHGLAEPDEFGIKTTILTSHWGDILAWLYPNGTRESRTTLIPKLYKGLYHLHNLRFVWERKERNIISVMDLPTWEIRKDDPMEFIVRMPTGFNTGGGARIGIEPLRLYGAQSAPKFRAWVRLAYLWDAAKIKNGGNRIYATVPEVLRNPDGYLVDAKGEVILTGTLYRTQGGWKIKNDAQSPQTAWYHPLSVHTGKQIRNPQADKVPILSDPDMVTLFYDNTERKGQDFRNCLRNARQHAQEMQADGRVIVEVDQTDTKTGITGWRILEPHPEA